MNSGWMTAPRKPALHGLLGRVGRLSGALVLGLVATACSGDSGALGGGAGSGSVGRQGDPGTNGLDGKNGVNGKSGTNGTNGIDGADGTPGVDGTNGTNGANGTPGLDGTDGIDGADAVLPGPVPLFVSLPKKKIVTTAAADFTFGCSAGDCVYEYSLDDGAFAATESPLRLSSLAVGPHKVRIRAKNADPADTLGWGNVTSYSFASRRPNILSIVADDLGSSDIGAFGGEIDTPNLDALARQGRILTNHHVGAVCAITRSMLISGTDHHKVGLGTMGAASPEQAGKPGYENYLNESALSVAQLLKDGGYNTYIAGKWHLGSRIVGATTGAGKTPDQWGFARSYTALGGGAGNHFTHEAAGSKLFVFDGAYVQPGQPGQIGAPTEVGGPAGYSTNIYTDQLIKFIDEGLTADATKPFYAFAAYTSPHWPLQVPEPWLNKYKGKYDVGYDTIAEARLKRQYESGLIPQSVTRHPGAPESLVRAPATAAFGTPAAKYINAEHPLDDVYIDRNPGRVIKEWDSLTPLEKKAQARYMEIYAGMVDNLDYNIGRLIQHLKDIDEYDYTFIIFHSDNGAEGWPINNGAESKTTDESYASEPIYSTLGKDNGTANARNIKYGIRWAEVSNTPLSQFKTYQGEGGLVAPAIVHLPGQTEALPYYRHFTHITDDTATFLALAGVTPPAEAAPPLIVNGVDTNAGKVLYQGRAVFPVTGQSLLPVVSADVSTRVHNGPVAGESYGAAYIISADGKWKARWTEPPYGPADGHWELFYVEYDRSETTDLSASNPELVASLFAEWKAYMVSVGGILAARPNGGFF